MASSGASAAPDGSGTMATIKTYAVGDGKGRQYYAWLGAAWGLSTVMLFNLMRRRPMMFEPWMHVGAVTVVSAGLYQVGAALEDTRKYQDKESRAYLRAPEWLGKEEAWNGIRLDGREQAMRLAAVRKAVVHLDAQAIEAGEMEKPVSSRPAAGAMQALRSIRALSQKCRDELKAAAQAQGEELPEKVRVSPEDEARVAEAVARLLLQGIGGEGRDVGPRAILRLQAAAKDTAGWLLRPSGDSDSHPPGSLLAEQLDGLAGHEVTNDVVREVVAAWSAACGLSTEQAMAAAGRQ